MLTCCQLYCECRDRVGSVQLILILILPNQDKQAIKTRQTDKQSIIFKEGEIKCCKEIKITAPPDMWRPIQLISRELSRSSDQFNHKDETSSNNFTI